MLKQMDEFLEWMNEEIIPTTPENLEKAIKNMAVLKIKIANKAQHEFEFFNEKGELITAKSPPLEGKTLKEKRKELEKEIRKVSFKLKRGEKNPSSFSSKKVYFTLTIKSSEWFLTSVFASANSDS